MSTRILNRFPELVFSSELKRIDFVTDLPLVSITISAGTDIVYSTSLYSSNGSATFYDLRTLVEDYMLRNNLTIQDFNIRCYNMGGVLDSEDTVKAVYCTRRMNLSAVDFCSHYFLSTITSKIVTPNFTEDLYFIDNGSYTGSVYCYFENAAGKNQAGQINLSGAGNGNYSLLTYSLTPDSLKMRLFLEGFRPSRIKAFSVKIGERFMSYYIVDFTPDLIIGFKNVFGIEETAKIEATTTEKTKSEHSTAISNETIFEYDYKVETTFEVETALLAVSQARWLTQMFNSPQKYLIGVDNNQYPIAITESTSETSNDNSEQCRLKFSYMLCETVPTEFNIIKDSIYTEQHTPQHR